MTRINVLIALVPLVLSCACNPQSREYATTGSVERLDPALDEIIPAGALPEILAEGFLWTEGPLWLPENNMLIFSDIPNNAVNSWTEKNGISLYLQPAGYTGTVPRGGESGSNGLVLDPKGRLVLCQHGDRRIARMDAPLDQPESRFTTLVDNWEGKKFNSPNDAVYSKSGDLYFTDPPYGLEGGADDPGRELDFTGVYRYTKEGTLELLTDELSAPNGIALSTDEKRLLVSNSGGGENSFWMEFDILPDSTLSEGRIFSDIARAGENESGAPDGMEMRDDGILFATGPGGIWVFKESGKLLGRILTGKRTANCTVGSGGRYLYMTTDDQIMRIKLVTD